METNMRALILEDFGTLQLTDIPVPTPGHDDALLRIIATGICGSDFHGYTGENGRRTPGQIMGHETVARVVSYGGEPSSSRPQVGSLVTVNPTIACGECQECRNEASHLCARRRVIGVDPTIASAFADYMVVPATNVVSLPAGLTPAHGALIEPLAVGYHAATRGGVNSRTQVLVVGAGPIGQAAILGARRLGASNVVVVEVDQTRRSLAARLGATAVSPTELALRDENDRFDVAIDAVGSEVTVATALRETRRGGVVVLVGMQQPRLPIDAYAVSTDERSIRGAFCYSDAEFRSTAAWSIEASSELDALITSTVAPEEADEAFKRLAGGKTTDSKVLVRFAADHG